MIKVTKLFTGSVRNAIIGWWGFICLLLGYFIGGSPPSRTIGAAFLFSVAAFCFAASWLSARIVRIEKRLNALEEANSIGIGLESNGRF